MSDNHTKEVDKLTGVETTGHEWDGLKELNNPAPRWWVWVFIVTIIWSVGYWVVYPTWPTPVGDVPAEALTSGKVERATTGATKGSFGWTQYDKLTEEQKEIQARQNKYLEKFEKASFEEIFKDDELHSFAMAGGKAVFKNNCATCHGSGAAGSMGFPNLNDDDWLWGGTVEDIYQTLQYGIRSGHDESRTSQMPSFGKDGVLTGEQVNQVVDYVLSLSSPEGAKADAAGATIFAENCASCHGDAGKGGRDFGAPNLTDAIWLYGGDRESVHETVFNARAGVMPFWKGKLTESAIRQVAVYVHGLGGGEPLASAVTTTPPQDATVAPSVEEPKAPANDSAQ